MSMPPKGIIVGRHQVIVRACQARPNPNIGRPVQAFARDCDRQVLVGGVLGTAEIGVRGTQIVGIPSTSEKMSFG
jgi:hypothetical protein